MLDDIERRARDFVRSLALKSERRWTQEHQRLENLIVELLLEQHKASIAFVRDREWIKKTEPAS